MPPTAVEGPRSNQLWLYINRINSLCASVDSHNAHAHKDLSIFYLKQCDMPDVLIHQNDLHSLKGKNTQRLFIALTNDITQMNIAYHP
jgi:hypothetical protein